MNINTAMTLDLTNILLTIIVGLLTVIGFFMAKFYDKVEGMAKDFHKAMEVQAMHEVRITNLEKRKSLRS